MQFIEIDRQFFSPKNQFSLIRHISRVFGPFVVNLLTLRETPSPQRYSRKNSKSDTEFPQKKSSKMNGKHFTANHNM